MIDVLLVDDEVSFLKDLAEGLRFSSREMHVIAVDCAEKAFQALRTAEFDVVVTDLNMPGMNGFDLLRGIREIHPKIPVIVMSAYTRSFVEDRLEGIRLSAYIEKPLDLDEVLHAITAAA